MIEEKEESVKEEVEAARGLPILSQSCFILVNPLVLRTLASTIFLQSLENAV
jgi:hypothetical protein